MAPQEWLQKRLVTIQEERDTKAAALRARLLLRVGLTPKAYLQELDELNQWANRHCAATRNDLTRLEKGIA